VCPPPLLSSLSLSLLSLSLFSLGLFHTSPSLCTILAPLYWHCPALSHRCTRLRLGGGGGGLGGVGV
jgi:hypothetical protein